MSRSFPLAEVSVLTKACPPKPRRTLKFSASDGGLTTTTRHLRLRAGAFTLIELLVVVAIIAILAALTLSTLGYVNKRGAESRARSEIAALSAAIESFKIDTGSYPSNATTLYTNLCPPASGAKVYFEPTPGMATNNQFIDPWGSAYRYSNYTTYFELFTTNNSSDSNNWIRN